MFAQMHHLSFSFAKTFLGTDLCSDFYFGSYVTLLENICYWHDIHSGCFYSASSRPLLVRGAPETARILCRSFTPKCHRQLQVEDLPKVYVVARAGFEPATKCDIRKV